jgi:hypothetical protein
VLYCPWNDGDGLEALRRATESTIGRLGLYRESPGLRMIVRILEATAIENPGTGGARQEVRFQILATYSGFDQRTPPVGKQSTVSIAIPPFYPSWQIDVLEADTLDDALRAAEQNMGVEPLAWQR